MACAQLTVHASPVEATQLLLSKKHTVMLFCSPSSTTETFRQLCGGSGRHDGTGESLLLLHEAWLTASSLFGDDSPSPSVHVLHTSPEGEPGQ